MCEDQLVATEKYWWVPMKPKTGRLAIRAVFLLIAFAIVGPRLPAAAQQTEKIYRIGYLSNRHKVEYREEALLEGLRALGYVEGKNLVFEWRFTNGKRSRLPEFAAELVRLKVDCIVTSGLGAAHAVKYATRKVPIPVVIANIFDPVLAGIVTNLARPGGNITGFTTRGVGLAGKLLDLLKEAVPHLSKVAVLVERNHPGAPPFLEEIGLASHRLGVQLQVLTVDNRDDFKSAFRTTRRGHADAIIVRGSGLMHRNLAALVDAEAKTGLPVMHTERRFVSAGGLMAYGVDRADPYRRAGAYLDKILKGTRPGDLPVQQPAKFELVINLKRARADGIKLSRSILLRATELIE